MLWSLLQAKRFIAARDFAYEAHRMPLSDKHGQRVGVAFVHFSAPDGHVPTHPGFVRAGVWSVLQLDAANDGTTR